LLTRTSNRSPLFWRDPWAQGAQFSQGDLLGAGERKVKTGRNQDKPAHVKSRKDFYDWLADTKIKIDGIDTVERDTAFDSEKLFSGGIRLGIMVTALTHRIFAHH